MRIEIAGAQITNAVVDVLETLQTTPDITHMYTDNIDALCRRLLLDFDGDDINDADTLAQLRTLQMIRRDILTLASPPDADLPQNDTLTASF